MSALPPLPESKPVACCIQQGGRAMVHGTYTADQMRAYAEAAVAAERALSDELAKALQAYVNDSYPEGIRDYRIFAAARAALAKYDKARK